MNHFNMLSMDKQKEILSAGFTCFGKMGYKKASAADIAKEAKISKAMIFHYFGSKKNMYLYLLDTASVLIEQAIRESVDTTNHDFFDRIIADLKSKETVIRVYPSIFLFAASVARENDPDVLIEITQRKEYGRTFHMNFFTQDIDTSKFKATVDPFLVSELISSYVEHLTATFIHNEHADVENLFSKAFSCVEMMRDNFYQSGD